MRIKFYISFSIIFFLVFSINVKSQELYIVSLIQGKVSRINQIDIQHHKKSYFYNPQFTSSLDFVALVSNKENTDTDIYEFNVLNKTVSPITQTKEIIEKSLFADGDNITFNIRIKNTADVFVKIDNVIGGIKQNIPFNIKENSIEKCIVAKEKIYCIENQPPIKNLIEISESGTRKQLEYNIIDISKDEDKLVYLKKEFGSTSFITYPENNIKSILTKNLKAYAFSGDHLYYTTDGKRIMKKSNFGVDEIFINLTDKLENKEIIEFDLNQNLNQILIVTKSLEM